ncbi:hypothetical protein [uncultured Thiodictyon sp.]|uniref:hypothetical protein n=1 Tax=uncultured Thiodictyon sp. TaxID=1846217 RepID=UPI0025D37BA7|nr:hypothetical protein [uncultured Thiodictyon sp.]
MSPISKRIRNSLAGLLLATGLASAADRPQEIRVDYAYYSPPSLILKHFARMAAPRWSRDGWTPGPDSTP